MTRTGWICPGRVVFSFRRAVSSRESLRMPAARDKAPCHPFMPCLTSSASRWWELPDDPNFVRYAFACTRVRAGTGGGDKKKMKIYERAQPDATFSRKLKCLRFDTLDIKYSIKWVLVKRQNRRRAKANLYFWQADNGSPKINSGSENAKSCYLHARENQTSFFSKKIYRASKISIYALIYMHAY